MMLLEDAQSTNPVKGGYTIKSSKTQLQKEKYHSWLICEWFEFVYGRI